MCVQGARWVQDEVLGKHEAADVAVFVIWEPMMSTDSRDRWRPSLIEDPRIQEFWDEQQVLGKFLAEALPDSPKLGDVAWDALYIFDGEAKWDEAPGPVIRCGTPIVQDKEGLLEATASVLAD